MDNCDQFVETRFGNLPCCNVVKHNSQHTPNLIGVKFGDWEVTSAAKPYTRIRKDGRISKNTRWVLSNSRGDIKEVNAQHLLAKGLKGKSHPKGTVLSTCGADGKSKSEYVTVALHWRHIFKPTKAHVNYKGMPFYDGWNPANGGSFLAGMLWIIENLGQRPGKEWSLDIIEHSKGFVPGNLRWALRNEQIANRQHRILGKFSLEELRVELHRHGYDIVKIKEEN